MDRFKFDSIIRKTEQRYGKVPSNEEKKYRDMALSLELPMYLVRHVVPEFTSMEFIDSAKLCLHDISRKIAGEWKASDGICVPGTEKLVSNEALVGFENLLNAYDPYINADGGGNRKRFRELAKGRSVKSAVEEYYRDPALCLLLMIESANACMKAYGSDGYFKHLEETIGPHVEIVEEEAGDDDSV